MKKKILIIGSTGFLGSNTLNYFCKNKQYSVYALTRKKQNYPKNIKQINSNLYNFNKLFNDINKIKFNIVINLALYVDHEVDFEKGYKKLLYNFRCTKNIITALNKKNIEKYIHIGSSDEYLITNSVVKEVQNLDPKNYYSLSKIFISNYLQLLYKLNNFPIVIIRPFLVYGEGQKENRLIPYIINNSLNKKKVFLYKKTMTRDFLYINDFLNAINLIIKNNKTKGETFNICFGKSYSINTLIKILKKKIENINVVYNSRDRKYKQPEKIYASNSKAKKILKWRPKISLEEGLNRTLYSFLKNGKY